MALTIETAEAEHPDVTALKVKVVDISKKYARKHNLCSVVDEALREMGVLDQRSIKVAIRFTVSGSAEQTVEKEYPLSALAGKSETEQNAFVAEDIAPKVKVAGLEVTLPITVVDLTQVGDIVPSRGGSTNSLGYPDRYQHFYTSIEGRVAHLVLKSNLDMGTDADPTTVRQALRAAFRRGTLRGLCGASPDLYSGGGVTIESPRSEHRVCQTCMNRAVA